MRAASIVVLCVVVLSCGFAFGEEKPLRTISVVGTAVVDTAPDQVSWRIELSDEHADLREAKKANDEKVKAVLAAARRLGVKDEDISTGAISVEHKERRDRNGVVISTYFEVTRYVAVLQRDLKRFDEFFDTLLGAADMELDFRMLSSRIIEVRADTRLKALKAAQEKAAAMAAVLGAKLGPVRTIDEDAGSSGYSFTPRLSGANFWAPESRPDPEAATTRFVPGTLSVSVSVSVVFDLE